VRWFLKGFARNPELASVIARMGKFADGANWDDASTIRRSSGILGRSALLGFVGPQGDGTSAFQVQAFWEVGGRDETETANREDRAFFIRLLTSKKQVLMVPRVTYLYRDWRLGERDSTPRMRRDRFISTRMLARNLVGLSRFDAFRLAGVFEESRRLHAAAPRLATDEADD
jgi:hypothetical protein